MPGSIHPTAVIDPAAVLAPDVTIGPLVVVEGPVRVGAGCVIRAHAQLLGPLTLGANNDVGRGTILGERPQHLSADGAGADVIIGSNNSFREYCTVHRGSGPGKLTRIGDGNYFMTGAHVAHDVLIGNRCIFVNNALLGGHCVVYDGAYVSGNAAVHQRIHVGRLAMLSGVSALTCDLPPFVICQQRNEAAGINVVGMRRAGYDNDEITAVRQAFRMLYMQGDLVQVAATKIERLHGHYPAIAEFVRFLRASANGICHATERPGRRAA